MTVFLSPDQFQTERLSTCAFYIFFLPWHLPKNVLHRGSIIFKYRFYYFIVCMLSLVYFKVFVEFKGY